MENRRIFSVNKIAWIISHGVSVNWGKEGNLVYVIVDEDIDNLLDEYYNNEDLHKFLNSFHAIKNKIKE